MRHAPRQDPKPLLDRAPSLLNIIQKRFSLVEEVHYTHLRIKHASAADANFVLEQIRTVRPDIVLLEWVGLSEQDIAEIIAYIWGDTPRPADRDEGEYGRCLFDGLRTMRKEQGYVPRIVFPDLRDSPYQERSREIGHALEDIGNTLRERKLPYKRAMRLVEETIKKTAQELSRRETIILKSLENSILTMKGGDELNNKRSLNVMSVYGRLHRTLFNAIRVNKGSKRIIAQKPKVLFFHEELVLRLMHNEPVPRDLAAKILFDISYRNLPLSLPNDIARSPNATAATIRRVANACTRKDMEAFYDAFLSDNVRKAAEIVNSKKIDLPDIQG